MLIWIQRQTNADPDLDPGQILLSQKVEFYMKNILKHTKAFLKGWNLGLFVNFGQFLCSWIRNRIPDMVPDQGEPNQCGSMRILTQKAGLSIPSISKYNPDSAKFGFWI
jgi:hypothetical protein